MEEEKLPYVEFENTAIEAMQIREMTVRTLAGYLYTLNGDIELDDCRNVAKALAKLGTIRIVGEV